MESADNDGVFANGVMGQQWRPSAAGGHRSRHYDDLGDELVHDPAGGDVDGLAGDAAGFVRGEKSHHGGDLAGIE